jgi:hypothetical protein
VVKRVSKRVAAVSGVLLVPYAMGIHGCFKVEDASEWVCREQTQEEMHEYLKWPSEGLEFGGLHVTARLLNKQAELWDEGNVLRCSDINLATTHF